MRAGIIAAGDGERLRAAGIQTPKPMVKVGGTACLSMRTSCGSQSDLHREQIVSRFGDASHVSWFVSLFAQFREAIKNSDFVGNEMKEAYYCVRIIERLYDSAAHGSQEMLIEPDLAEFR